MTICLTSSCRMSSVVLVRNEQDFPGKPGPPLKRKVAAAQKKNPRTAKRKIRFGQKKAAKVVRGEGKCCFFFGLTMLARVLPPQIVSEVFFAHKEWILTNRSQFYSLEISKINSYFLTPKKSVLTSTR